MSLFPRAKGRNKDGAQTFHKVHPKPMKMLCVEENWVPPGEVDSGASAGEMGFAHAKVSFQYREAPGMGVQRLELCSGCVCSPDVSSCRSLCNPPAKFVLWANCLRARRAEISSSLGQHWDCREAITWKQEISRS